MSNVSRMLQSALQSHQAGLLPAAEEAYRKLLRQNPLHLDALHLLGVLFHQTGRNEAAIDYIGRAIALNPAHAVFHGNLGAAYQAAGRLADAQASLTRAIRISHDYPDAHNNLGTVLHALGRPEQALIHYRTALRLKPDFAEAQNNLGNVLKDQGFASDALDAYQQALRLKPGFAEALNNIGSLLQDHGRLSDAAGFFEQALAARPEYAAAHSNLGNAFRDQGKWTEAMACFERALAIEPLDGLRIRSAFATPVIIDSVDAIDWHRSRIEQNVTRLVFQDLNVPDPVSGIGLTALYLAYHGRNDRKLQAGMARVYARATPSLLYTAPHCATFEGVPTGRTIRIGFISRHFHDHSNARLNLGLMKMLSRQEFRVVQLRFPGQDDAYGKLVQQSADEVVTLPLHLDAARRQVADQNLDILFYTDVGMEPLTYFLAFARLAPVQCTTWGVPVTTGIPAIDYYLSSTDLEPENAETHYTERLVRLEHLPTYYYPPAVDTPLRDRGDLGLDSQAHLYVCPQSLFKLHPEFDALLGAILRADPRGQILLLSGQQPQWTQLISNRLNREIPDVAERVKFLPRLAPPDFLQLLRTADVLLDPVHFGGGNTTYEALAYGTPIVTWPREFMRSRVTRACYHKLGVLDCVAASAEEYVQIAVRLATDRAWRSEIRSRILAKKEILFENTDAVRELEQFFINAVQALPLKKCA